MGQSTARRFGAGTGETAPTTTRPAAVVTGGSDGIGRAIARRLAGRGKRLLLVARSAEALATAAASIRTEHATEVEILALDLTAADATETLAAELARRGWHVDLLVNNAGIGYCGHFDAASPADLERLLALDVAAPSRLMHLVLPGMRERRRGGILNIASLGGYVPGPYQAAYYASKAYLLSLSEAVAAEAHRDGVRVTAVAPGPVATQFHARMGANNALYRTLVPELSSDSVARWALLGHDLGLRVVAPGVVNSLGAVALRLLPHVLLVPLMALLLDPRRTKERGGS